MSMGFNCGFEFEKGRQLLNCMHNKASSVAALCGHNPNWSAFAIRSRHTAAIPSIVAEIFDDDPSISRLHYTPPAALRSLGRIFQSVQMRAIFAGVATVWQRCASPINSCQSGADKQFVQVTTACGYDDCIVARSKSAPPTCVDRERLCK